VATLIPKAEIESAFEENQMGLQARLMSKALRKLSPLASKHNVTIIFINQYREKIGIMYGDSKVPCGGNSLKYYASVRVQMTKKDKIENSEKNIVGNQIEAKVLKNKLSPPYTIASFQIIFGKGIDRISEIINISVDKNIIAKAGAFYSFEGIKLGQGFENAKTFLRNNDIDCFFKITPAPRHSRSAKTRGEQSERLCFWLSGIRMACLSFASILTANRPMDSRRRFLCSPPRDSLKIRSGNDGGRA
jgi:recombination protein RecA